MRPLKLTMSAFGPYAGIEIIDFEKLNGKNIFLVTGPTGAGKTTIFDGISYGLFGEASGTSRDNDSLRSDFASPDTPTFIELEFELRGERYNIKRYPQQMRKKQRGEGFSFKNSEAVLTLPEGNVVTGTNAVDEKIASILGINKNQFRQIVMLPQGEFRKLLEAESKEKEIIFRKLFGTETFEIIQSKLGDKSREIEKKIATTRTRRDTYIRQIEPSDDDTLLGLVNAKDLNITEITYKTSELIKREEDKSKIIKENINIIKEDQERLQRDITRGQEGNKKLLERESLRKQYEIHISLKKEYDEKQIKLDKSRKALEVKVVEDSLRDREVKLEEKKKELVKAENELSACEVSLQSCKEQLSMEEAREDERKKMSDNIATYLNFEVKVSEYENKILTIKELKNNLKNKQKLIDNLKLIQNNDKLKLEKANKEFEEAQRAETNVEKLNIDIEKDKYVIDELRRVYSQFNDYKKNINKYNSDSREFEEFDGAYKNIKNKYESMEDKFRRGQAGLLAKGLNEGSPCPVCGSTQHPSPAGLINGVPTQEELKKAKEVFEKSRNEREEKLNNLSILNELIKKGKTDILESKESLKKYIGDEIIKIDEKDILDYLKVKGKKLGNEINDLRKEMELLTRKVQEKISLSTLIEKLTKDIKNRELEIQNEDKEYIEIYGTVKSQEELISSIEKEIPEDIRSLEKLQFKINELKKNYSMLEKSYKKAQEDYNSSVTLYASLTANRNAVIKNIEEVEKEVDAYKESFNNKLKDAGFTDMEEYLATKMDEKSIKLMETDILEYHKNLKSIKDRLDKAINDTKDIMEVSLEELNESLNQAKLREQKLKSEEMNLYSRISSNKRVLDEVKKVCREISIEEESYKIIGELAKVANGANSERITFERYVLAAYFDEIISAANIRLAKMASERYKLRRKEDKGKGSKQEGLELEVFDNYTGKARHVKTLSGGESFKASLSLALGLADVIQSYAGGISLDTMFVDEGFGTLDSQSLDNAIQCLIDLQSGGRLVGIISHVPELKERIDARLEITPAKEGSKTSFMV